MNANKVLTEGRLQHIEGLREALLQQQLQVLRTDVLQEDDVLAGPELPEEAMEVGTANTENELVSSHDLVPGGEGDVRELLVGVKILRPGKEQSVVIVPFQEEVFARHISLCVLKQLNGFCWRSS